MKALSTVVCAFGAALAYGVFQPLVAVADATTDKPSGKPFVIGQGRVDVDEPFAAYSQDH